VIVTKCICEIKYLCIGVNLVIQIFFFLYFTEDCDADVNFMKNLAGFVWFFFIFER